MLKVLKVIGISLISLALILGFLFWKTQKKEKSNLVLIEEAIKVGNEYVKIYNGSFEINSINSALIDQTIIDYIVEENEKLKSKEDGVFDVDKYFYEYTDEFEGEVVKEANSYDVLLVDDTLVDDARIQYVDDKPFIPLNALDPYKEGQDSINYKGVMFRIDLTQEQETYTKIINNPNNNYIYATHDFFEEADNSYVDILYNSVIGESSLLVRLYLKDDKLSKIEVSK